MSIFNWFGGTKTKVSDLENWVDEMHGWYDNFHNYVINFEKAHVSKLQDFEARITKLEEWVKSKVGEVQAEVQTEVKKV